MGLLEPTHLILIAIVVLVLFGPKRIPEFMRGLGKGMGELQKGINEGKAALANAMHDMDSTPAAAPAATPIAEHVVSSTSVGEPKPEVHPAATVEHSGNPATTETQKPL